MPPRNVPVFKNGHIVNKKHQYRLPSFVIETRKKVFGLTRKDIGDMLGLAEMTILKLENNYKNVTMKNLLKYLNFLGFDIAVTAPFEHVPPGNSQKEIKKAPKEPSKGYFRTINLNKDDKLQAK